jgi:NADPH:quinone reductase-like Zn-dependent oxidoreductase
VAGVCCGRCLAGVALPAGMSNSTAAQILSNRLTAVILTSDELDVRPGECLLQTAAGSTVGQSASGLTALYIAVIRDPRKASQEHLHH